MRIPLILFTFLSLFSVRFLQAQSPYESIKDQLLQSDIILIGEPDHAAYACIQERLRLIRYIQDSLGQDVVLAFESGLYEMNVANRGYQQGAAAEASLEQGIHSIWQHTAPINALADYMEQKRREDKPFVLAGFDSQISQATEAVAELEEALQQLAIAPKPDLLTNLQRELNAISHEQKVSDAFDPEIFREIAQLERRLTENGSAQALFWSRFLQSAQAEIYDYAINKKGKKTHFSFSPKDSNLRDSLMAENLLYLKARYPDKKIIGWGATYHFANEVQQLAINGEFFEDARPMGYQLKKQLGNKVLLIGVADLKHLLGKDSTAFIESEAKSRFIDFHAGSPKLNGSATFLGYGPENIFPEGNWANSLDLGITIDTSPIKLKGMLLDEEVKAAIPYAHIQLASEGIGTLSTAKGSYQLSLDKSLKDQRLTISAVGYEPITYAVKDMQSKDTLYLKPSTAWLKEVAVSAQADNFYKSSLTGLARAYQQQIITEPHSMDWYYKSSFIEKNNPADTFLNEAAIRVYSDGFTSQKNQLAYSIINRRELSERQPPIPYSVAPVVWADMQAGIGLQNKKFREKAIIDSVQEEVLATDTLVMLYYHLDKPSHKLVGMNADSYRAWIQYYLSDFSISKKGVIIKAEPNATGLSQIEAVLTYARQNGKLVPRLGELYYEFVATENGVLKQYQGKDVVLVHRINSQSPEPLSLPFILEFNDAPYDPEFWEGYTTF